MSDNRSDDVPNLALRDTGGVGSESTLEFLSIRRRVGLLAGPIVGIVVLLLPAPPGLEDHAWYCVAVGLLMAIWWMTEAISIFVTSLLPLVLLPLLGIADMPDAAAPYANPLIFLFMGGFMIALAMERWKLHRRVALSVVLAVGTKPARIIAGFMLSSAILSMWVSNTATAMMMLPIGISVIGLADTDANSNFGTALMLGLAYACSIGGLATLIGTPVNALMAGFLVEAYGFEISFASWFMMMMPISAIGLVVTYLVLTKLVYPIRLADIPGGRTFIQSELRAMGKFSKGEKWVALVFGLVAALWMSRPFVERFVPGISDAGIAMAGAIALFLIPVDARRNIFVLDWSWARRLPWGVLILFGGGLSLASAINDTGLASWLGHAVAGADTLPIIVTLLIVVTTIVFLTELTSNTATAAAFIPVLASVAIGLGHNPLLLVVPAALAASCAFMLPVATPPNAIVYGSGYISIAQMSRAGIVLNILFIFLITFLSVVALRFGLGVVPGLLPDWLP